MTRRADGSAKAIFYALGANLGIAVAKYFAAAWTGSGSMLAEAIHSTADCANQLLLLLGMRQARRPETEDHPLGYHRVVYFWSMIVALMLFFLGGAFSVYEGIERLRHPAPLQYARIAMAVLGIAVALESISLWGAMREIRKERGDKPFLRWFRETRQSELMVVAGEDIAALAGLVMAFAAVSLSELTGDVTYDAIGTVGVGLVLMLVATALMREVKALIVGESLAPELRREIHDFVAAQPEVAEVFRIISLAWGDKMVIAVKARMTRAAECSGEDMVHAINAVEERIQAKYPDARWV